MMKVFLVAVSSLCLCGILLCFWAYATGNLSSVPRVYDMPKTTTDTQGATMPQQAGTQKTTVEEDPLCSPCEENLKRLKKAREQWEGERNAQEAVAVFNTDDSP